MDDPALGAAEMAEAFRFIRRVNRWLGGTSSLRDVLASHIADWPRGRPLRWLDVGTGAADIPLAIDRWSMARGLAIECVALDRHPACLSVARAAVGNHPRIAVVEGDALDLGQFANGAFDYVHAGMFLHHLVDPDVVRVLSEMGRCASRSIVWNDLLRNRSSRAAIALLTVAAPAPVRFDARLSVAKGFTPREAIALAMDAGLRDLQLRHRTLMGRFVLTASAADRRLDVPPR